MARHCRTVVLGGTALVLAALFSAGCSSAEEQSESGQTATAGEAAPTTELPPLPAEPAQPGAVGVSPDGVTTSVDVPSDATESQYGQACLAAKRWMDEQGGDPVALVEPYLKVLQAPGFSDPGNFNTPWTELTPAQQAGVIMAANAAANGDCG